MVVSLAEAQNNAATDLDVAAIDEFRKRSVIIDSLQFDNAVNPVGGGATLVYGYRRQITQAGAAFRGYNTEYTPSEITTQQYTVNLHPLGGSFQVDRVLAKLGPAASGSIAINLREKIKATSATFQDAVINGDSSVNANSFDGLNKALTGSSTEFRVGQVTDWSDLDTDLSTKSKALDAIDEFLGLLDGAPTILVGNAKALAKFRAIVRRSGMYVQNPVDGLLDVNGRPVIRQEYGGMVMGDAGEKAGSSDLIIPTVGRTVNGTAATGLTDIYAYRVGLDGFHGVATIGSQIVQTWMPDYSVAGAVKTGEVEMGPVAVALKATKAAAVFRNIKVQ